MPDPFALSTHEEERRWLAEETGMPNAPPKGTPALLSTVFKMNCLSFGIPAYVTCPASDVSRQTPQGICNLCYAAKGRYVMPGVKSAMQWRLAQTRDLEGFARQMNDVFNGAGPGKYVKLQKTPGGYDHRYFRVHHSGDFYSPEYIAVWKWICTNAPRVRFWFPTRIWAMPVSWRSKAEPGRTIHRAPMLQALKLLAGLPNVTVRPSALAFDQYMTDWPHIPWLARPTGGLLQTAITPKGLGTWTPDPAAAREYQEAGVVVCPAGLNKSDRACCALSADPTSGRKPCRICWDRPGVAVVYPQH